MVIIDDTLNKADITERNRLVEENIALVTSRVSKLNGGIFDNDLFQVGCEALIKAAEKFDKTRGFQFSTFAVNYINWAIIQYKKIDTVIKPCRKCNGNKYFYKEVISLDMKDENGDYFMYDYISDGKNMENEVIKNVQADESMKYLDEREKKIITLISCGCSQKQIGKIIGLSQAQVSRLIKNIQKNIIRESKEKN